MMRTVDVDRTRFPVNPWALVESRFDDSDLGTTETLFAVGNGYLGMRGNHEEGRPAHEHGTYVNGLHETWPIKHAEDAFGFARVGQTIVNAPDAKTLKLYVDDEPLLLGSCDIEDYSRLLDFRTGEVVRGMVWRTSSGNRVRVTTSRLVSMTNRHIAQMSLRVVPLDRPAHIVVSSQLLNRQDGGDEYRVASAALGEGADPRKAAKFDHRVMVPQHHLAGDGNLELGYRLANSGMTVAVVAEHQVAGAPEGFSPRYEADEDIAKAVMAATIESGEAFEIVKTVAYHTSRGVPVRELIDRCHRSLDRVRALGHGGLAEQQRQWLADFWERSDVRIEGQRELQQAVRWNLLQVAQASICAQDNGIAAKGVTGSGYDGHYFWDTEVYTLPFLTYTNPDVARAALRFRYLMLDAARRRATDLNQHGALFPWRTISGEEASAYYPAGTAQYHIDADVAHALNQYVAATGDIDFLAREGIDILVETARMFEDLGFWRRGTGTFHINRVTGPDEYTTVVNDNLYTNVMAKANMRTAAAALEHLRRIDPQRYELAVQRLSIGEDEPGRWAAAAEAMHLGYDEANGIHPQDAQFLDLEMWDLAATDPTKRPLLLHYHPLVIYRFQVIKQADVVLSMLLAGDQFTPEEKRANFDYYDPITTGDSTLSAAAQSIIAAEVGYEQLAVDYFRQALFVDIANLHGNVDDGVHVASAGGVWMTLVHGFAGMRDHGGQLSFDPRLPGDWPSLAFTLQVRGCPLGVEVTRDRLRLTRDGDEVTLRVRGETVAVGGGRVQVDVPLDDAAVPHLTGAPAMPTDVRREDGSVVRVTLPPQPAS